MKMTISGARPALFLDLDSTVRYVDDPKKPCPNKPSDVRIYPKVVDKINNFKKAGFYIFGVSNQGGIELGHLTNDECVDIMEETDKLMGFVFDEILWAPNLESEDRKPNPGMIYNLRDKFNVDLESSIMVGDKDSDLMCSLNAGIKQFFYAKDFFIEGHNLIETKLKQSNSPNTTYVDQMR